MVRMFAILSAFGLVVALLVGVGGNAAVRVTYFGGGMPTYDASRFEDCGPATLTDRMDDDCYRYLRAGSDEPLECNYILGFRAGAGAVTRLRVSVALMRDGALIGRDTIRIGSLQRPADDPYVTETIRGACEAKQLHILEARASVDGQETDLIAAGAIRSAGFAPFMPDFFVRIGPAAGS
jgi:hypothetical protein